MSKKDVERENDEVDEYRIYSIGHFFYFVQAGF